jgi:hypothetical protein
MFQVFLGVSCVCLQVFHLDVVYVCNDFQFFPDVFASVSSVFFCMLQLLHMDVSKEDCVLHMGCTWEAVDGVGDVRDGVGDVRSGMGPLLVCSRASPTR